MYSGERSVPLGALVGLCCRRGHSQCFTNTPWFFLMNWIIWEKTWKNRVLYDTNGLYHLRHKPHFLGYHYRMMRQCMKVGEGVYGEVFTTRNGGVPVALKVRQNGSLYIGNPTLIFHTSGLLQYFWELGWGLKLLEKWHTTKIGKNWFWPQKMIDTHVWQKYNATWYNSNILFN